jgi:hypothetical protein
MDYETCNYFYMQTSKCQGKGIFIFNKISDISKWKGTSRDVYV